MPTGPRSSSSVDTEAHPGTIARIAVGIDGYPEGRDAAVLGAALARATKAELMLVAIHPDPLVVLPSGMDWKGLRKRAEAVLRETRDAVTPDARIVVETDISVARALHRVIGREHRDLLVVGSSRHGPEGRVRIGKRTRQLLCHFECGLAIAPRGMHKRAEPGFARIGVGYDGGPESQAALALAGSIAVANGAELRVRGVVDDRMPAIGRWGLAGGAIATEWEEVIEADVDSLRERAVAAAESTGASLQAEVVRGRPADALLELCADVDLLVIGSRRWGWAARVMLGSTGEALLHDGGCPVLVVPRPHE